MYSKIKLYIFIVGGMFASADRAVSVMGAISLVFDASPLYGITSLRKLGYECKVNENILYVFFVMRAVLIIAQIKQDYDNYNGEKPQLLMSIVELIMLSMSLLNCNQGFVIIINAIIKFIITVFFSYNPNHVNSTIYYLKKILIISILQYWNFSNTVQRLFILLSFIFYIAYVVMAAIRTALIVSLCVGQEKKSLTAEEENMINLTAEKANMISIAEIVLKLLLACIVYITCKDLMLIILYILDLDFKAILRYII